MIPSDIKQIILSYLAYLERVSSTPLLLTGLVLIVLFVSRTTRSLMYAINGAMRVRTRRSTLAGGLLSVLMTVGLLMAILIALIFLVAGDWLTALLSSVFPHATALLRTWHLLRALIPPGFFFVLLLCLTLWRPPPHLALECLARHAFFHVLLAALFLCLFLVCRQRRPLLLSLWLSGRHRGVAAVALFFRYCFGDGCAPQLHCHDGRRVRSRQSFIMSGNAPYYVFKD